MHTKLNRLLCASCSSSIDSSIALCNKLNRNPVIHIHGREISVEFSKNELTQESQLKLCSLTVLKTLNWNRFVTLTALVLVLTKWNIVVTFWAFRPLETGVKEETLTGIKKKNKGSKEQVRPECWN